LRLIENFQETDEDEGDDAIAILFTVDMTKDKAGLIFPTKNRERISKSDTGFPYVKYGLRY